MEARVTGGEGNEGGQGFSKVLEVLGETPASSEPGEGALDHPAARQDDEAPHVVAPLDDLHAQQRHLCHHGFNLPRVVAAIGPDQFEPRDAPAAWWDDPRLGASAGTWLEADDRQLQIFARRVASFADLVGDRLSPERRDFYQRLIDAGPRLNVRCHSHRDMTIVKGDAHVRNIFLPQTSGSDDVRIFDWDAWRVDVATDDLAYMMALHWFPDHRRRHERQLLDHYHAAPLAHGVAGYDRRALDDDYRLSVLWQIATPVWQAANNIPAWIWGNHLERIFMAVDDLGCRELLAT
jgi:Ecdysteroid kinase-like family